TRLRLAADCRPRHPWRGDRRDRVAPPAGPRAQPVPPAENTVSGADRTSILLSAFACDPLHGSERQVGWCWMKLLSRQFHRVFVLTREFNRASHPAEAVPANVEFVYFDLPFGGARIPHKSRFIKPYYILWQLFALLHVAR